MLAARLLALMLLLFEFMVEIPPVFTHPHSQGAWGGAVYNFTRYWGVLDLRRVRRKPPPEGFRALTVRRTAGSSSLSMRMHEIPELSFI